MNLGRRTVYALLLAIICANLLVRLPQGGHETGVDSFFIHRLAGAISEQGHIPWVLNPLGYFGWYPLSYPSAGPLLISGFAQVAAITEEAAILYFSLAYAVLGVLASFVMARAFRRDDAFALVVAIVFSFAPRFALFTMWSGSTRNLFMVLIPIFLFAIVRASRRSTPSNLFIMFSVLALMLATHRLTILLAVVVFAFVLAYIFVLLHRVMRIQFPRVLLAPNLRRMAPHLALVAIIAIAGFMLFMTPVLEEYSAGELCSGESWNDQLCNLGVSISRSVGLALPFVAVGVFAIVREHNKGFMEAFLVFSLLALIPTLFLRQYTGFYILPFLAVFTAFGLMWIVNGLSKRKRARNAVLLASLVVLSAFAVAVLDFEVERATSISDANYTTALYVKVLPEGNVVSNDGLLAVRIFAISNRGGLPVGGAGTISQSAELLIMGAFNATEILEKERRKSVTDLTIEDDSPFFLVGIDARNDWVVRVLQKNVDDVSVRRYNLQYYLDRDDLRSAYTAFGNTYYDANFADSVYQKRYKLLDGTTEDLYLAFSPSP